MKRKPKKPTTLPWRDHLHPEERAELAAIDAAKDVWMQLNKSRAGIVNRAINRTKYVLGLR
jgi:hypothetical protein